MNTEVIEGNKLIAEFMRAAYWKAYNSKANYSYWATHFSNKDECQQAIDKQFKHPALQYESYEREQKAIMPKLFWDGEYHSSWDCLMPVVKKILEMSRNKSLELNGKFIYGEVMKRYTPIGNECWNVNLENVHYSVVQFIKWYNNLHEHINAEGTGSAGKKYFK